MLVQTEIRSAGDVHALGNIVRELAAQLRRRQGRSITDVAKRALASLKAVTLTLDPSGRLGASIEVDAVPTGDLELDVTALARDVGRYARQVGTGVLVCIDELQEMRAPSLAALAAAVHMSGQQGVPFFIAGAGLPNLPARLGDAKSYAERLFDYRPLGRLDPATARSALVEAARSAGASWDEDAAEVIVAAADGYPYFLQQFGAATWDVARDRIITRADAQVGVRLGHEILDGGFFRSRWDRATPTERLFLAAMAVSGDEPSATTEVARRMGRTQSNIGPIRAGLIAKGLIYAPEHGYVGFTVPGMAAFIRRHDED
jgi:predicted transcriptional regulator